MAGPPRRRLLGWASALGMAAVVLVGGVLAAVAGAYDAPPGPTSPLPSGAWIAFHIDSSSFPATDGTTTISVVGGSTGTTTDLWGASGNWPTSWSTGGLQFTQADSSPCSVAVHPSQSCT